MEEYTSCSQIRTEAQKKYQNVIEKIKDLQRIKNTLIDLIDSCANEEPNEDCPILKTLEGNNKKGRNLR
jgi:MerR family mercuric resistance operon transcriptional regulator